jgi:hypothetical protein
MSSSIAQPPACLHSIGTLETLGRGGGRCAAAGATPPRLPAAATASLCSTCAHHGHKRARPAARVATEFVLCAATTMVRTRKQPPPRTFRRLTPAVVVATALASAHGSAQRSANRHDCSLARGRQAGRSPGLLPGAKPSTMLIPHPTRTRPSDSLAMVTHRVFIWSCND